MYPLRGRTFLVPKEGCEGRAEQYRLITCQNICYKLLTGTLTCLLEREANDILPYEQKALRKGCRGCIDALLFDSSIREKLRILGSSGAMGWIDYQKAYDRVPHGWLLRVLKDIKAPCSKASHQEPRPKLDLRVYGRAISPALLFFDRPAVTGA